MLLTHSSSQHSVLAESTIIFLLLLCMEKGQRQEGPFLLVQPLCRLPPTEAGDTAGEGRCFTATATSSQAAQSEP